MTFTMMPCAVSPSFFFLNRLFLLLRIYHITLPDRIDMNMGKNPFDWSMWDRSVPALYRGTIGTEHSVDFKDVFQIMDDETSLTLRWS
jgi:hypothetical protein